MNISLSKDFKKSEARVSRKKVKSVASTMGHLSNKGQATDMRDLGVATAGRQVPGATCRDDAVTIPCTGNVQKRQTCREGSRAEGKKGVAAHGNKRS